MTTAKKFFQSVKLVEPPKNTKDGTLYTYMRDGDSFYTFAYVTNFGQFILTLPIGNKIHGDFFSAEDQCEFLDGFRKSAA
jgi:hypothetical protein